MERICCVCHQEVAENAPRIGDRLYCAYHFEKVKRNRKTVWLSTLIGIAALGLFVVLVYIIDRLVQTSLAGGWLVFTGIVLSLIPAGIWLVVFYRMDSLEPEPKEYVLGIFILGAILAQGVAVPLINNVFKIHQWLDTAPFATRFFGSVLLVGIVQEYLKYAAVRFTIYKSKEFDERVDGVLYGAVVGLGFALMLNIFYIIETGGADLTFGVVRIAVTTLAHTSFGAISGFFLGIAKFEEKQFWWLPAGVGLAALLNGVHRILLKTVSTRGLEATPALGLIFSGVFAVAVFFCIYMLVFNVNKKTVEQTQGI